MTSTNYQVSVDPSYILAELGHSADGLSYDPDLGVLTYQRDRALADQDVLFTLPRATTDHTLSFEPATPSLATATTSATATISEEGRRSSEPLASFDTLTSAEPLASFETLATTAPATDRLTLPPLRMYQEYSGDLVFTPIGADAAGAAKAKVKVKITIRVRPTGGG